MAGTIEAGKVESEGTVHSTCFQGVTKLDAVRCLNAAIESFLVARSKSRDWLAEDICGVSQSYFSKIINGEQGDFFGFVYGKLPGEIRQDFIERLAELERLDPFGLAIEQLLVALFRMIRTTQRQLPARASQMAHVGVESERKRA